VPPFLSPVFEFLSIWPATLPTIIPLFRDISPATQRQASIKVAVPIPAFFQTESSPSFQVRLRLSEKNIFFIDGTFLGQVKTPLISRGRIVLYFSQI